MWHSPKLDPFLLSLHISCFDQTLCKRGSLFIHLYILPDAKKTCAFKIKHNFYTTHSVKTVIIHTLIFFYKSRCLEIHWMRNQVLKNFWLHFVLPDVQGEKKICSANFPLKFIAHKIVIQIEPIPHTNPISRERKQIWLCNQQSSGNWYLLYSRGNNFLRFEAILVIFGKVATFPHSQTWSLHQKQRRRKNKCLHSWPKTLSSQCF